MSSSTIEKLLWIACWLSFVWHFWPTLLRQLKDEAKEQPHDD